MSEPLSTSALSHRAAPAGIGIGLSEVADRGMIDLRGLASDGAFLAAARQALGVDLPLAPRSSAAAGDLTVLWLSVDQWLVLCPRARTPELLAALSASLRGIHSLACDMSDARTILRLEGEGVREVLMKGTSLDLLAPACRPGFVKRALFGEIAALVHVVAEAPDVIDLFVFRSYADYAWEWLLKTARAGTRLTLFGEQPAPPA